MTLEEAAENLKSFRMGFYQGVIHQRKYPQRVNSSVSLFSIEPSACILFKQVRKRAKWDNDDYVCRGLILNGMSDPLFDIYQNVKSSKELWDSLQTKYMAEDASSKKFLAIQVFCIVDKLPLFQKDLKHILKHKKEELTLVELASHLRIEESLKGKHKQHDNTRADPNKKAKLTCWKCGKTDHIKRHRKDVNVGNKADGSGTKGSVEGSSNSLKGQMMFNKSLQDEALDKFKVFKTEVELQQGSLIKRFRIDMGDDPKTFNRMLLSEKKQLMMRWIPSWATILGFWLIYLQGYRQKSVINYFDIYALVARISTIRLLIAMTSIHNLIIHQMDVKIAFLNGEPEEEVDLTKEFLSLKFSMKDMGDADVILGIRIKHESNGIAIFQSHYIEKVLKKFNYFECTLVSTLMDTRKKLMPNNGQAVSQLEYYRVIGCLIAATLAKAYSQMYNGKSRHLGVRHSMIRELITNGMVSIEFVRSQQNLDDHLTKGLARDLFIKSAEGMGLKSN
nr:zinc finger, CCHC-type [Tanacetum cinerariifolium]